MTKHWFGTLFCYEEHPRRDTDVILRTSKALIEFFNFTQVPWLNSWSKWWCMTKQWIYLISCWKDHIFFWFCFDPGIISGPSRHRESMFSFDPNIFFLWNVFFSDFRASFQANQTIQTYSEHYIIRINYHFVFSYFFQHSCFFAIPFCCNFAYFAKGLT